MPTYDYVCDSGDHRFERVQRFSDEPLKECVVCGAPARRVIHPVGIIFKGQGWYVTDNRHGDEKRKFSDRRDESSNSSSSTPSPEPIKAKSDANANGSSNGDGAGKGADAVKPAAGKSG